MYNILHDQSITNTYTQRWHSHREEDAVEIVAAEVDLEEDGAAIEVDEEDFPEAVAEVSFVHAFSRA